MTTWDHIEIQTEQGNKVKAQAPLIVSASRSTDIPAFYCDWLFHRMKIGYSVWRNPFNNSPLYVSYSKVRFIIFWSKNPRPLLPYLDYLKEKRIGCYIQYSLNDYEDEKLEHGVPKLEERIETFKLLVDKLGKGGVIWRFDPLMLTPDIDIDKLLKKIENIGDQLKGYTEKLVFSFADISIYNKVKKNLDKNGINARDWTAEEMRAFASELVTLNKEKGWNYKLATCGEAANLDGIEHNHCIDDELIIRRAYKDAELMKFLGVSMPDMFTPEEDILTLPNGSRVIKGNNKDTGQRDFCGCMKSKDIGQYDTCIHGCEYCYANTSKQSAANHYKCHKANPLAETITGM